MYYQTVRVVMVDAPDDLIAERHRLGLDKSDEVWEGEYHMVPPAGSAHGEIQSGLVEVLRPMARAVGLRLLAEWGVFDPEVADFTSFRVPDLAAATPDHISERGVEGAAALVIEIRSPGDETFQKFPFYERVGVAELLVIDRDTKALRHWIRQHDRLVESGPDPAGVTTLRAVPAALHTDGDALVVDAGGARSHI